MKVYSCNHKDVPFGLNIHTMHQCEGEEMSQPNIIHGLCCDCTPEDLGFHCEGHFEDAHMYGFTPQGHAFKAVVNPFTGEDDTICAYEEWRGDCGYEARCHEKGVAEDLTPASFKTE